ncbi:sensor histidine kinase [Clostridium oceanicum]|uniref:Sensor histidine kinase n=1 Tax=Clostridium oceanicum TaxID=1543 RepID=A0ABN1JG27_9CLOT
MDKQSIVKITEILSTCFTLPFLYSIKYYFYKRFLGFKHKPYKFILFSILLTLFNFFPIKIGSDLLNIIISDVIWLLGIFYLCNGGFLVKFYAVIVDEIALLLINLSFLVFDFNALTIIHKIDISFSGHIIISFMSNVINDLVRFSLLFIFLKNILKLLNFKNKKINLYQGLYLLIPCLSTYALGVIFYIIQEIKVNNKAYYLPHIFPKTYYILPFVSFALLISILMISYTFNKMLQCEKEEKKNLLMGQQLKLQFKHTKDVEELYNNIKTVKHDMNNHLCCLKNLVNTNNIEEMKKYLGNINKTITKLDFQIKTGNCISDAVINEKFNIAKSKKINFECDFIMPKETLLAPIDTCVILSNALDNAIESCTRIVNSNIPKSILVKSYIRDMYLIIEISNTTIDKLQYNKNKIISKKSDKANHGIGICNIKSTVKKYNGVVDILEEKNKFTINIMIKIK